MASPRQTIDIPLAAGLNTKADSKAMESPSLAVATDIQFDDIGGIQTRPQFQAITDAAGNTISQIRKLATYNDELLAFSKDKLWSYSAGDGLWVDKGDYLAATVDEKPRFVTTGDQYDCDRAEHSGVTFYTWTEDTPSGTKSYIAVVDSVTGAVKLEAEDLGSGAVRCRLIAAQDRVSLMYVDTSGTTTLRARVYNPTDLTYLSNNRPISTLAAYDIIASSSAPSELWVIATFATGWSLMKLTEAGVFSTTRVRTVTVGVACSVSEESGLCVAYNNGTSVRVDFLTILGADFLTDVVAGVASSSTVNQISSVYDGTEFSIWWSSGEASNSSVFHLGHNSVSVGGAGTATVVRAGCGLVSSAFLYDSSVYAWAVFAGVSGGDIVAQLQNNYFLIRSDGLIVAKSVASTAGGFTASQGFLPGVSSSDDGNSFAGQQRRIIPLGQGQRGYSAKSLSDIAFKFDQNSARRTETLGATLYLPGGIVSQYDGESVSEVGFHVFPWELSIIPAAGANLNGTYNWKQTFAWYNAAGDHERSTTATLFAQLMSGNQADMVGVGLKLTAKTGGTSEVAVEFWRQVDAAAVGAPFFLVTSKDPGSSGDNSYFENDSTANILAVFSDDLSDADLVSREAFPENGGLTLESLPPPAATIITVTQDRILLAGIPGNPNRIVYSKLRAQGEIASFHDILFVDLPSVGGKITALAFLGENLIVFKENAVYSLPGDGYNNAGQGNNYGPGRVLTSDVGAVNQESVALTPKGLIFKSSKGWYILTYGWQATFIGFGVTEFDGETVLSALVMESQHQVRILTDSRTIVWDYLVNQWSEWSITGTDAIVWNGVYHIVNSANDSLLAQSDSHSGAGDLPGLDIETGWVKLGDVQGYKLIRKILILGEYLGAHDLRVRIAYNYNETWIDDKSWTVSPTTIGGPLQLRHKPSKPKSQSIKIRITAEQVGSVGNPPLTEALNLTALSLEVALKEGSFAGLSAGQKQ